MKFWHQYSICRMKIYPSILSNLILFGSLILYTGVNGQTDHNTKKESSEKEIGNRTESEKLSDQLELALQIYEGSNQEAQELAKSALVGSQEIGDKSLEMRSYYVLGRICMGFSYSPLAEAYYDSSLYISNITGDLEYKAEILFRKGVNYYRKSDQVKALETYSFALAACREVDDFKVMGSVYSMMGTIFRVNGIYDRAIEYNIKSSLSYKKANYEEGNAWINYLLGRIYADLNSPQKALEYFYESLDIYKNISLIDGNSNGIAICQEQISLMELSLGNLNKARSSIDIVLKLHTEGKSKYGISSAYTIFGKIEYSAGDIELAENYLNKSLDLKKEIDDTKGLSVIYEYLGLCLVAKGQVNEGLIVINQGLQQAEINEQRKIQLDIYTKLVGIYYKINNLDKANFYQNEVITIQDELLFSAASVKMEQLQAFYEIDEKNDQIFELEKENEIHSLRIQQQRTSQIFMIIGILLAVFIAMAIYLFYRKIQQNNRQLNMLNITKDKLFSIISHDLRGPMGSTLGLSEVLLKRYEDKNESNSKKLLISLHNGLNETYDLLTNLLQWASTQIKGISFNPESLSMNSIIEDALKPFANQAEMKNVKMTVDIDKTISVWADINMLDSILRNLITNAIKFTNENGNIVVNATQRNNVTQVCVKDDGIGMSSDTLNNLFSLDMDSSKKGTSGERGTGLGLILCKEFVDIHKGEFWIESTLNKGSSFYFTIPGKD